MVNRKKKDYQNGKIYCIRSYKTDLVYIGSSCQPLYKRLNEHKKAYKAYLKTGISKFTSSKIYELDDAPYIELIKNYPCSCLDELRLEEGKHIRIIECVNKNVAGRTKKEWYEDNKDQLLKQMKEYYEQNKEKIKEKHKEYGKEYREHNKEKIKEKDKKYREHNKEKLKQKITCSCGGKYTISNKAKHERSNKHKQYIESCD